MEFIPVVKNITLQGSIFSGFPNDLLSDNSPLIYKEEYELDSQKILVLHNVFTDIECNNIINLSELCGFESLSRIYPENYRNNLRIMVDDKYLTDIWYQRMKPEIDKISDWNTNEFIGMNQRLRICKYNMGGKFGEHYDTPVSYNSLESLFTVMAYLNDVPIEKGGSTRFFSEKIPSLATICIQPKKGSVVIFKHNTSHDGEEFFGDKKYIVRSDIMIPMK